MRTARSYCCDHFNAPNPREPIPGYNAYKEANFGRLGCDPPTEMIDKMIHKMSDENPDIDVLLVNGDHVGHTITMSTSAIYDQDQKEQHYSEVKRIIGEVAGYIKTYFPNAIVLPTYGNNDAQYHYQPPVDVGGDITESDYYNYFFDMFFEQHPTNSQLPQLDEI